MPPAKPQREVDWVAVWKGLNWDDEKRQQVVDAERLRQRAQHYAAPVKDQEAAPEHARSILTFELGRESYGIDVTHVRGIRAVGALARVPGAPGFYQGVINMRGQIISVIDLRSFFQIPPVDEVAAPQEVIIVQAGALEMALLAHQVIGVESIPSSAIKPVEHMPYALGLTREKTILLDIAHLFRDERLIVGGVSE